MEFISLFILKFFIEFLMIYRTFLFGNYLMVILKRLLGILGLPLKFPRNRKFCFASYKLKKIFDGFLFVLPGHRGSTLWEGI